MGIETNEDKKNTASGPEKSQEVGRKEKIESKSLGQLESILDVINDFYYRLEKCDKETRNTLVDCANDTISVIQNRLSMFEMANSSEKTINESDVEILKEHGKKIMNIFEEKIKEQDNHSENETENIIKSIEKELISLRENVEKIIKSHL